MVRHKREQARRALPAHLSKPTPVPTRLPYRVRTLGRIRGESMHSTLGTYHDDAMLTVIVGGKGWYRRGGTSQRLETGMVGLVLPIPLSRRCSQTQAGLMLADPDDPYDHLYCRFAGREALRVARRILQNWRESTGFNTRYFFDSKRWQTVVETLLRGLAMGQQEHPPYDRLARRDAVLAETLALLDAPTESSPERGLTAASLRHFLMDHVAEPTELARVANHFGVSVPHLCRLARSLLGDTVQQTWEQIKIDWACTLLAEPSLTVVEVAARVGYCDAHYFSRVFKQRKGVSPSVMRERGSREG